MTSEKHKKKTVLFFFLTISRGLPTLIDPGFTLPLPLNPGLPKFESKFFLRRFVLDTDGRGWARPFTGDFSGPVAAATVAPVPDPCSALRLDPLSGEVPLPAFDDDRNPGSVAVPFASGRRLFSVDAIDGDRPLLRYYALASGCVESPQFRRKLHGWFNHTVRPLLAPGRRWYPALAGASVVIQQSAAAATDRFKRSGGDGDPTWTGLRRSEK